MGAAATVDVRILAPVLCEVFPWSQLMVMRRKYKLGSRKLVFGTENLIFFNKFWETDIDKYCGIFPAQIFSLLKLKVILFS